MANTLTKEEFNQAMCDVRKAHRLIYAYQRKMLDLTYFIKSKLDFPDYKGNPYYFGDPIKQQRDGFLQIRDIPAWDFLYSYVFEYYFGEKNAKNGINSMFLYQVSDTGYFDNEDRDEDSYIELATFASEIESASKLVFYIDQLEKEKTYIDLMEGDERWLSANFTKECLNDNKGNIQIYYSFPLDRFLNEDTTIDALKEFIEYCNNSGVSELEII